ncbi:hypothetical protein F5Y08DRAFT_324748 [Xylaria arbuscula]|nr:hypothetical protein F5Y08DRAFT_324748 [Xylaria arbuscula]
MPPTLKSLPLEVILQITAYLTIQSILNLRLTCRALSFQLSPHNNARFFLKKTLSIDKPSVDELAYMTEQGRPGCFMQHCTIISVAHDENYPANSQLLTNAFKNLGKNSSSSGLGSRSFGTPPYIPYITKTRLDGTTLQNNNEDLHDVAVRRSLPYSDVLPTPTGPAPWLSALTSLRHLTINLTSKSLPSDQTSDTSTTRNEVNYDQSLHCTILLERTIQLLEIMPQIETLHLYWYNCGIPGQPPIAVPQEPSPLVSEISLQHCSIQGMYIPSDRLLAFLKSVRPAKLHMTDIYLISGSWIPIFEYLSSTIMSYYLDDLRENAGQLVHFDGIGGNSKFRYSGVEMGPSTLLWRSGEARAAIEYRCTASRPMGSPERRRWLWEKVRDFGPR